MIIALTGKKRSGKDVCADYLQNAFAFRNYKFASPIKRAVADIFLWDDEWVNGVYKEDIDPRWGISSRQMQQILGTEMFREFLPDINKDFRYTTGNNIWVNRFKYWYETFSTKPDVVVSDLRFLNEAEVIKEMGGKIIRINRAGLESNDLHASEMEMEQIVPDYTIENDSTIAALESKICKVYGEILDGV